VRRTKKPAIGGFFFVRSQRPVRAALPMRRTRHRHFPSRLPRENTGFLPLRVSKMFPIVLARSGDSIRRNGYAFRKCADLPSQKRVRRSNPPTQKRVRRTRHRRLIVT